MIYRVKVSLISNIIACYLISVSMGMLAALLPVILFSMSFNESQIGLILTFETVAAFLICFGLPFLLKHFNMSIGIVISTLIRLGAFAFLIANFQNANALFWITVIFFTSVGTYSLLLLSQVWVNALPISHNFGLWMAIYSTAMSVGLANGPLLLNELYYSCGAILPFLNDVKESMGTMFSFSPNFTDCPVVDSRTDSPPANFRDLDELKLSVAFMISMIAVIPLMFTLSAAPKFSSSSNSSIIGTIIKCKGPMLAIALAGVSYFGVSAFIVVYGIGNNLDEHQAVLLLTAFNLGAIFLEIPLGWLSDKIDRRFVVVLCTLLCATCAAFLPLSISHPKLSLFVVFLWGGVVGAIYSLALALIGERFKGSDLVAANAGYSVMEGVGGTFGIIMIGFAIHQFNSDGLPYVIMLSSVLFIAFALTRYKVI